jgi:mannose-6-phosphate isomerase-like protein (cupin superfamily)
MEAQNIPIYRDIGVRRVQDLPLKPWKRTGGKGTFIQLLGTEGLWGSYVVEVPGAGALNAEKHLYEEQFLVVEGRGTTEVWVDGNSKKLTFEWQKGSIFAIPMNAMHRIVNATSSPALLLAGTTAPNIMNNFDNEDFIFNCPYHFKDRFDPRDDYYKYKETSRRTRYAVWPCARPIYSRCYVLRVAPR